MNCCQSFQSCWGKQSGSRKIQRLETKYFRPSCAASAPPIRRPPGRGAGRSALICVRRRSETIDGPLKAPHQRRPALRVRHLIWPKLLELGLDARARAWICRSRGRSRAVLEGLDLDLAGGQVLLVGLLQAEGYKTGNLDKVPALKDQQWAYK